uniref:Uncharacterized protein n=1 Tax=Lotharella oceanica TaxID=641309 RepID=A0A7S2X7P2_9EUKA|mmetsp:Transcript_15719/g.29832  ORF Transcript_15719/g.29832 Transcript_15719/m.29832 type:complete len:118 (+) Transcript_15719:130-483(+)
MKLRILIIIFDSAPFAERDCRTGSACDGIHRMCSAYSCVTTYLFEMIASVGPISGIKIILNIAPLVIERTNLNKAALSDCLFPDLFQYKLRKGGIIHHEIREFIVAWRRERGSLRDV